MWTGGGRNVDFPIFLSRPVSKFASTGSDVNSMDRPAMLLSLQYCRTDPGRTSATTYWLLLLARTTANACSKALFGVCSTSQLIFVVLGTILIPSGRQSM